MVQKENFMELNAVFNPKRYYRKLQHLYYVFSGRLIKVSPEQTIYLLQTPVHNNIGDQAIAYAEIKFLTTKFPQYKLKIVNELQLKSALKKIARKATNNDVIMIHGGGNMGDIWPGYEEQRQQIFYWLKYKKIVSFPQSIRFLTNYSDLAKKSKEIYSEAHDITLVARESTSYDKMKSFFGAEMHILYTPDIVISLNPQISEQKREGIATFLRNDVEKQNNTIVQPFLEQLAKKYVIKSNDTVIDYTPFITNKTREKFVLKKFSEFSSSKLIITDRLHGMIFAMLTGTPAIVFDNNNKKVSSTYNSWLKNANFIYLATDYTQQELIQIVNNYLATNKNEEPNNVEIIQRLHQYFDPLAKEIGEQ